MRHGRRSLGSQKFEKAANSFVGCGHLKLDLRKTNLSWPSGRHISACLPASCEEPEPFGRNVQSGINDITIAHSQNFRCFCCRNRIYLCSPMVLWQQETKHMNAIELAVQFLSFGQSSLSPIVLFHNPCRNVMLGAKKNSPPLSVMNPENSKRTEPGSPQARGHFWAIGLSRSRC